MLRSQAHAPAAAALAFIVAPGCGRLAGVDEYDVTVADPRGPHAGFTFSNSACGDCMTARCRPLLASCREDATCAAWLECLSACQDGACEFHCYERLAGTNDLGGAVVECQMRECTPSACEVSIGAQWGQGALDCARASGCRELMMACAADDQCRKVIRCSLRENAVARANPASVTACVDAHDMYRPGSLAREAVVCIWGNCLNEIRHDRRCANAYRWRSPLTTRISVEVLIHKSAFAETFGDPLPDLTVRACSAAVQDCSGGAEARTDVNGIATFELKVYPPLGWDGYFRLRVAQGSCEQEFVYYVSHPLDRDVKLSIAIPPNWNLYRCRQGTTYRPWQEGKSWLLAAARDCHMMALPIGDVVTVEAVGGGGEQGSDGPRLENVEPGLRTVRVWWNGDVFAERDRVILEPNAFTILHWLYPPAAP